MTMIIQYVYTSNSKNNSSKTVDIVTNYCFRKYEVNNSFKA